MSITTPELILKFFDKHNQATAADIAAELHLTHADIRYHLQEMQKTGLVEVVKRSKTLPRGRPARVFRKPFRDHPPAMEQLLSKLIINMECLPPDDRELVLIRLAEDIFQIRKNSQSSSALRILNLINAMNNLGYHAKWEIRSGCSQINLNHCPYRKLVKNHPILCELDRIALVLASGSSVNTLSLIADESGHPCRFEIV